jgi:RNA polymerase sigma factor (sigma-70 family)
VTDSELLQEYSSGRSEEAFRRLAERYSGLVYSTCVRRLGNPQAAEDVTQAVFLALARKAGSVHPRALSTWLYRAAELGSLRHLRDSRLRAKREREAAEMVSDREREQTWREIRPELDLALAGLPARYRQVIIMHYLAGRPVAEVAAELGRSPATVRSMLSRGIGRLRGRLVRRGATHASVAAVAAALGGGLAAEPVPADLAASVSSAVLAEATSSGAAALSGAILKSFFWAKCRMLAATLLAIGVAGTGGTVAVANLLGPHGRPGAFYRDMPDNTWVLADENSEARPPRGMFGASGGTIDIAGRRLLAFGGGHTGYAGNEVWSWHIEERRWRRLYAPDRIEGLPLEEVRRSVDNRTRPGMWLPSGRPIPRSSYSSIEFVPEIGGMTLGGFSTYNGKRLRYWKTATHPEGAYPAAPHDFWIFRVGTAQWNYLGSAKAEDCQEPMPAGVTAAVYLPDMGSLLAVDARNATWSFDVRTRSWTRRARGGNGYHPCLTYDRRRKLVYGTARKSVRKGSKEERVVLRAYDPFSDVWKNLEPESDSPATWENGEGISYDSRSDVVLLAGYGGFWVYRPDENRWIRRPVTSKTHPPKARCFNRLRYDPVSGVTFCFGPRVWAYRYRRSGR